MYRKKKVLYISISFCALLFFSCKNADSGYCEKAYIEAADAYAGNELDKVIDLTGNILSVDRNFYQAALLNAKALFFAGNASEAESCLKKLVKKVPEYTEARIWYIRVLILNGKYQEAEKMLEKELSYNQTDWRLYYQYAVLANRTDDYEKRLSMLQRAETALTDSSKVFMDEALFWYELGLEDRSKEYIDKAKSVSGSDKNVLAFEKAINQLIEGDRR